MQRLLILILLILFGYYLVKKIGKSFFQPGRPEGGPEQPTPDAELIKDPQCGAYFLRQRGIKGVVNGEVVHFCSEACYDKYLKEHKRS